MVAVQFDTHMGGVLPARASAAAAGWDLRSAKGVVALPAWLRVILGMGPTLVHTGLRWEPESERVCMEIKSRSGMAVKHNVHTVAGLIDADYRGEIIVALDNRGLWPFKVNAGDRVAQCVFTELPRVEVSEGSYGDGSKTDRGDGGFGSTGTL